MHNIHPLPSSYRDNDGFVFKKNNAIYRLIKPSYFNHYNTLMQSGLYANLINTNRLIPHIDVDISLWEETEIVGCKVIKPTEIPFISYPYEWSFDMWRDAAIVTLKIALQALEHGMYLKDATPFNIQFYNGRPVFIDTLSFEIYENNKPWIAYRQFCENFLSLLLLMHYGHRDLGKLLQIFPAGIPLEITKKLLPFKAMLNVQVYLHIWLQANISQKKSEKNVKEKSFSKQNFVTLLNGLLSLVINLKQKQIKSVWNNYYTETILGNDYLKAKSNLVEEFSNIIQFEKVIDFGANDGHFAILLTDKAKFILATDADSNCINTLYNICRAKKIKNILPLVNVINTPSPAIGWNNAERNSMTDRLQTDLVLALALIHHLAIANNVPLSFIAKWLARITMYLVIEFVPKSDEKVQLLLKNREDIFDDYNILKFKEIFSAYFIFLQEKKVGETDRVLFLMKRK